MEQNSINSMYGFANFTAFPGKSANREVPHNVITLVKNVVDLRKAGFTEAFLRCDTRCDAICDGRVRCELAKYHSQKKSTMRQSFADLGTSP